MQFEISVFILKSICRKMICKKQYQWITHTQTHTYIHIYKSISGCISITGSITGCLNKGEKKSIHLQTSGMNKNFFKRLLWSLSTLILWAVSVHLCNSANSSFIYVIVLIVHLCIVMLYPYSTHLMVLTAILLQSSNTPLLHKVRKLR